MKTFKEFIKTKYFYLEDLQQGEGYQEAGELMSQTNPDIFNFIKNLGIPHIPPGSQWSQEDDNYAIKLGKIIDSISSNETLNSTDIPTLKNLANKPAAEKIPQELAKISGQPDAAQKYIEFMQNRDNASGRNRGYNVADLVDKIQKGNYSPPVLIKGSSGLVVVGGRTRLYAALALGVPIKVKILDQSFMQKLLQNPT